MIDKTKLLKATAKKTIFKHRIDTLAINVDEVFDFEFDQKIYDLIIESCESNIIDAYERGVHLARLAMYIISINVNVFMEYILEYAKFDKNLQKIDKYLIPYKGLFIEFEIAKNLLK